MPSRPDTSLGRVLHSLGGVLELAHGQAAGRTRVGGVAIYDPFDEPNLPSQAIVLGVAVRGQAEICELLGKLGSLGASALVVRSAPVTDAVRTAVERCGVSLLHLVPGAAWTQLAALLRILLAEDDIARPNTDDQARGDLFALANAIATLIDAPVTIEDRTSQLLAYSGRQDEGDSARIATILGRQVPERNTRLLTERGIFDQLYQGDGPIFVEGLSLTPGEESLPRTAIAVRAGEEVLGSIWAAVRAPLDATRAKALREAADMVALQLLRIRAGADVERRLRADLVSTALEGGPSALEALARLRLSGQPMIVLACTIRAGGKPRDHVAEAQRTAQTQQLASALSLHLGASQPWSATALIGDVAYGILSAGERPAESEAYAVRIATEFTDRIKERIPAIIGIGPIATDTIGLTRARVSADRALRVLQSSRTDLNVARIADIQIDSLLMELGDMVTARGDGTTDPIARLITYDKQHNAQLVETFRAWLDAFGDVIAASERAFVHPNTFRYRVRRVAEVAGIDLEDPDVRFAAMLQLRLMAASRDGTRASDPGPAQDGANPGT